MSRRIPLCFACLLVAVPAWAAPPDGTFVPGIRWLKFAYPALERADAAMEP